MPSRRWKRLKALSLLAAVEICAFSAAAQGVIANDAAIVPFFGSGQYLTLTNSINPSQGRVGLFAIEILPGSGSQFTLNYAGIAEEYALYSVTPGIIVDSAFATSTTPLVSNNGIDPGSSVQTFSLGQSRYFAYWDDRPINVFNGMPDITDNYGWVLITRSASGLQVSSSATAIGGGIIAGTFTQVPEPSVSLLILLGLGFCLCVRRFAFVPRRLPSMRCSNPAVHTTTSCPAGVPQIGC